jgi:hypothetical protein
MSRFQDKKTSLKSLYRSPQLSVEPNEPFGVADVTIALQFALDSNLGGLQFPKM